MHENDKPLITAIEQLMNRIESLELELVTTNQRLREQQKQEAQRAPRGGDASSDRSIDNKGHGEQEVARSSRIHESRRPSTRARTFTKGDQIWVKNPNRCLEQSNLGIITGFNERNGHINVQLESGHSTSRLLNNLLHGSSGELDRIIS